MTHYLGLVVFFYGAAYSNIPCMIGGSTLVIMRCVETAVEVLSARS